MRMEEKKRRVNIILGHAEQFGITHLMNKKPYDLSGGEKQRVAISRALINNPDLILADEPTGNLDSKSGDVVIHTLSRINRELGKTIVMVTHDPKMASYCSRLILLKDGLIMEDMKNGGDQEEFYQEILGKMKELLKVHKKSVFLKLILKTEIRHVILLARR